MLPQHLDHWLAPFPAKVTAVTNSSGTYLYEWIEQITDGSGGYTNAVPARSGTNTVDPALELNNRNLTPSNTVVWMRFRGMSGANTVYEFDGSGMASSATTFAVREVDGSPNVTSVTLLSFNSTNGLSVSGTTGEATTTLLPASLTQMGGITTGSQTITGTKTIQNVPLYLNTDSSLGVGGYGHSILIDGGAEADSHWDIVPANTYFSGCTGYVARIYMQNAGDSITHYPTLVIDPRDDGGGAGRFLFHSGHGSGDNNPALNYPDLYLGTYTANAHVLTKGGTGTVSGLTFQSGLYISGSVPTALNASNITSGTLATNFGGTGLNTSAATNGQLLIGTGTGLALNTLTAGPGATVTNGSGSITIGGNLSASAINTGVLNTIYGGTGLNTSAATNGQLLIGTGTGLALNTLTAGHSILVTNGEGTAAINVSVSSSAPGTSIDSGDPGMIAFDSSYLYICVSSSSWKRIPLEAW